MKRKISILILTAAFLLSGCADSSSDNSSTSSRQTSQTTAVSSEQTTTVLQTATDSSEANTDTSASSASQSSSSNDVQTIAKTESTSSASTASPSGTTTASTTASTPQKQANTADKTKPTVFDKGLNTCHLAGKPFDLNDYVSYGDDTDRHPKLTYTGKVDVSKTGDYPIRATVTDASGNSESWDLTISVVSKLPTPQSIYIPSMSFETFTSKYKAPNARFGLDVSQFQGSIDFNAVKNAGCSFVFIRVGTRFNSFTLDTSFKTNLKNALAAGLDVGVYLYTTDHTAESARQSAKWIVSQLGGKKLTLPVAFDWEEINDFQSLGASINDVNNAYAAFKSELSKSGYSSMIYSSSAAIDKLWNAPIRNSEPVWIASYTDKLSYMGNYGIWQVCYGKIAGINVVADFNVLYTDKKYK